MNRWKAKTDANNMQNETQESFKSLHKNLKASEKTKRAATMEPFATVFSFLTKDKAHNQHE